MFKKLTVAAALSALALLVSACDSAIYDMSPAEVESAAQQAQDELESATELESLEVEDNSLIPAPSAPQEPEENSDPVGLGTLHTITVDACDLRGLRQPNVQVDIGYGDERTYWAKTNSHGQLVEVTASTIQLQKKEEENSRGRYCKDEAKVPGVESPTLDEGHVIGDALGGVSNAYNITPQDSTLNRHGDQYQFELLIQQDGGARNFKATISYPDDSTMTPSHYTVSFIRPNGEAVNLSYDNAA